MNADNELLKNLDKLHTTELGVERIKRNLSLDTDDVLLWRLKIDNAYGVPDEYLVSYNYGDN